MQIYIECMAGPYKYRVFGGLIVLGLFGYLDICELEVLLAAVDLAITNAAGTWK